MRPPQPPDLSFRAAEVADLPAIVALVESAFRGEDSRAGWTTEADLLDGQRTDAAEVGAYLADPHARFVLAHRGDDLVASVLVKDDHGEGYVGMLSVAPGLQTGGLGSRLLTEAEHTLATAFGVDHAVMTVLVQRPELIAWYERRGWIVTGERRPFPYGELRFGRPKRADLEFVVLRKRLRDPC